MRSTISRLTALAALAVVAIAPAANAQSSASSSANVTAVVLGPLTASSTQALSFGKVGTSVNKAIAADDATSARIYVQGQGNAGLDVTFSLPTELVNGGATLPIDSWVGTYGSSDAAGGTAFTPVDGQTDTYRLGGTDTDANQRLYFRIGARVVPAGGQAPGNYTGTLSVTFRYNEI